MKYASIMSTLRVPCHALAIILLFAAPAAWAGKDAPTADQVRKMQEAIGGSSKELDAALEGLDPETRKQLDALTPQSTGPGQTKAKEARDSAKAARLAKINSQPLSPQKLRAYVDHLHDKMGKALKSDALERARSVELAMPKGEAFAKNLRAAANGLAVAGFWPEATWLTSRLAQTSGDAGDLNNLAAFLTMQNAAAPALPILHTLNSRYPDNSTLLNNLGQSYYQLGATDEAERYLVAAVRITPAHPQANVARAAIQQAKGDKANAQVSLQKALDGGYAPSKVSKMRKAGGKWQARVSSWHLPMPPDPLGLEKIALPEYPLKPKSILAAIENWAQFRVVLREIYNGLDAQRRTVLARLDKPGHQAKAIAALSSMPLAALASEVMKVSQPQLEEDWKRAAVEVTSALLRQADRESALSSKLIAMEEKNNMTYANDTAAEEAHRCDGVPQAVESYLRASNPELETIQKTYLEALRKSLNAKAYMAQFMAPTPDDFESVKLGAKRDYTRALLDLKVALNPGDKPHCLSRKSDKDDGKLADFNDIHCQYIARFELGPLGSMTFKCDTSEAHFNPGFSPLEFAWKIRSTGKSDEWQLVSASATVKIDNIKVSGHGEFDDKGLKSGGVSVEGEVGTKTKGGPLEIGVEATVKIGVEIDRGGVTDIIVSAGVETKATGKVIDAGQSGLGEGTARAGVESKWGWNAGPNSDAGAGFNGSALSP